MSSDELSMFSYRDPRPGGAGRRRGPRPPAHGAPGPDRRLGRQSQYYVEPKLARLGYLDARREPGERASAPCARSRRRARALRPTLPRPPFTPVGDALLQLLIADLVGEAPTRASLDALREDVADTRADRGERGERPRAAASREVPAHGQRLPAGASRPPSAAGGPGGRPRPGARRGRSGGGQVGALEVGDQGVRAQLAPGRLAHEVGRLHAGAVAVRAPA